MSVLGIAACSGGGAPTAVAPTDAASAQAPAAAGSVHPGTAVNPDETGDIVAVTREDLAKAKPVTAAHAMVVSAQHYATQAGVDILKQGGNAVDAAVAVGYAEAVVHSCCGNIGGGGFMNIRLKDGRSLFLNFREKAPLKATPTMFQDAQGNVVPDRSTDTYLAVGVPGTVMGFNTALKAYGTMSLKQVMAPAIKLANEGYVLRQGDIESLGPHNKAFAEHANVAAIFLNDGKPWKVGDRLVQKQLAHTLQLIADGGTDAFYKGPIAKAVVKASDANGGILSMKDFADYTAQWETP
ncbi:MAG TPA: gamma-glutamyltransferase, partial [Rhodanobacter sp.]|nr:gamma-glutamyltransferase [Rhodanobacter sp.]